MARHVMTIITITFCVLTGSAEAAKKETAPLYPHYWMSVSTGNQSIPGMNSQMSGLASIFGQKTAFGPHRSLQLQLESPGQIPAKPAAQHDIPATQKMGKSLPLMTPEPDRNTSGGEPEKPQKVEKPKARMLIYWGCGDTIRKGQPRVIDTEKMNMEAFGKALVGRTPTPQYSPAMRKGWVYGDWPNKDDSKDVPNDSSLVGEHLIRGNYVTDIRFNIDQKHDFMAPVEFTSVKAATNGAFKVEWKNIPTATGYFAAVMAHNPKTEETILWSSSEVPETGFALMNYLTNSDVQRFIREKVVMPVGTTTCTVPPAFKDATGALQFIAYGDEMNIIYPPKPNDPKKTWNPQWSVKVRLKSTAMTPLMETVEGESRKQQEKEDSGSSGSPVNKLKGLFGF
jgi:hypothetical protein